MEMSEGQAVDFGLLSNEELLNVAVKSEQLTVLEVELVHRLETYLVTYGDYMACED